MQKKRVQQHANADELSEGTNQRMNESCFKEKQRNGTPKKKIEMKQTIRLVVHL